MTRPDSPPRALLRHLAAAALLLGLAACGEMPVQSGQAGAAQEPGFHFHNDVVLFSGVGGGINSR